MKHVINEVFFAKCPALFLYVKYMIDCTEKENNLMQVMVKS